MMPKQKEVRMAMLHIEKNIEEPSAGYLYDFVRCVGDYELEQIIQTINENKYDLVCVTQSGDMYTIFFRRYAP
jgi:hypothetical protein